MYDGLAKRFDSDEVADLRHRFATAEPFPHVVIDDFLTVSGQADLRDGFPCPEWSQWSLFHDEYQKEKRVCPNLAVIPKPFSDLIIECSQPPFLKFLEAVTGAEKLLTDPYLDGGGLHCSGAGGVLTPHTDFHYYHQLELYRVLNLLIYCNEGWGDADGGRLGLYRKGEQQPSVAIKPSFGRAVIFKTDDRSVHGFAGPVAPGKWRKSVALYYYVSRETGQFSGDTSTHWQTHGPRMRGPRLAVFQGLMFASRAFSKAAHIINPNKHLAG